MSERRVSRRRFLRESAAGMAALGASTVASAQELGANERLSVGVIGCGARGSALMREIHALARKRNVRIEALCDVWRVNLARAATRVEDWFGHRPREFTRFGDLLALREVDAVVIATPDFSHAPIMIAALKAGKDVYVEKPMALEVSAAFEALQLARKNRRVVQVGTQKRSQGAFRATARELASGVLGHVSRVSAAVCFNHARWARDFEDCKESDVDWEAFLFDRPRRPFDPRLLRRWQLYQEFTNGMSGLWMSHYVDAVHLLLGARYPASAVAHGGIYFWKDGREHTDNFHALLDYPEGFLFSWAMSLTNSTGGHFTVHGSLGTLDAEKWTFSPAGGLAGSTLQVGKIRPEPDRSHVDDWLECLRTRQRPNADIKYGYQHSVATIMAAAALNTGQRQRYDPEKHEVFAG